MTIETDIQSLLVRLGYDIGRVDGDLGVKSKTAIRTALQGLAGAVSLNPSDACLSLIKSFEGCRLTAYPDPGTGANPWTIGWGSTGADVVAGTVWAQAQADARFADDVFQFSEGVTALLAGAATTQGQFDALVSFSYNVGLGALGTSTLLKLHKGGDHAGAADQFAHWKYSGGKVLAGLVRRRAAEAELYAS